MLRKGWFRRGSRNKPHGNMLREQHPTESETHAVHLDLRNGLHKNLPTPMPLRARPGQDLQSG